MLDTPKQPRNSGRYYFVDTDSWLCKLCISLPFRPFLHRLIQIMQQGACCENVGTKPSTLDNNIYSGSLQIPTKLPDQSLHITSSQIRPLFLSAKSHIVTSRPTRYRNVIISFAARKVTTCPEGLQTRKVWFMFEAAKRGKLSFLRFWRLARDIENLYLA